jgi:multidrug efflux pump subunit AcrA (membrane-fusion protein)
MKKRKRWKIFVTICVIVAIGIGVYFAVRPKAPAEVDTEVEGIELGQALPVKVTIAQQDTLINYIRAEGIATPQKYWRALAEESGTIEKIYFQNGDRVNYGQLIVKLSNKELEQQLVSASIQYQKVYAEYLSLKRIMPNQIEDSETDLTALIDQSNDVDEFKEKLEGLLNSGEEDKEPQRYIALQEASANLEQLYARHRKLFFYAPFSGVVGDLYLKEGNFVSAGTQLFQLTDLKNMEIDVTVMETELVRLRPNAKAYLQFLAYSNELLEGSVISINPFIDEKSRLGRVKIGFVNPIVDELKGGIPYKISPGMFAECYITAEQYPARLLVPNQAVLTREEKQLVFTVENGRSYWRYVTTGLRNEFYTEILEGISPEDSVIVEGHYTLIHDAKLDITEVIPFETFSIEGKLGGG